MPATPCSCSWPISQDKAKHDNVKKFAKQARTDFQQMQNRWANMSSNNDMKAGGMGQLHHDKIEKVQKASGKNFDQTYMTVMIQQLHDRVSYWEKRPASQLRTGAESGE